MHINHFLMFNIHAYKIAGLSVDCGSANFGFNQAMNWFYNVSKILID